MLNIKNKFFKLSHTIEENPVQNDYVLHTHEYLEFFYFITGKGVFHIEGNNYQLHPGDIIIMNGAESHYVEVDPSFPYERLVINFKKDFLYQLAGASELLKIFKSRELGKNNLFSKKDFGNNLYLLLINNILNSTENDYLEISVNFLSLLNEMKKAFDKNMICDKVSDDNLINKIANYIINNLDKPICVESICKEFFLSSSTLHRLFKKSMGTSVWNYITIKRLMQAKHLIESGLPPTKAYLELGFSDYSVFFRAFKKFFGYSPNEISKNN